MLPTVSPASAGTARPGRSAFVLWAFGAWTVVAASHFYALTVPWEYAFWGSAVRVLTWAFAIWLTTWTVRVLVRRAERALAAVAAALAVLAAATIALTDWASTYATVWFATHEAQFAAAAELAETGARHRSGTYEYPWVDLPPELRSLDAGNKLRFQDQWGRPDVAVLYTYFREPNDTVTEYVAGFAYLPDGPGRWPQGSWGGEVMPRIELGGGWWWVD